MENPMDLFGKCFIVTGASSGIGRETAVHLTRLGARVVCVARSQARLEQTLDAMDGTGHSCYCFDLEKVEDIGALLERIVAEQGKLDGFAYCAGVGNMYPFKMTDYAKMVSVFNTNVFAFLEMARILAKRKNRNACASFVGISSAVGIKGVKGLTAYGASKGAMDSAVRTMARELGPLGIRVNTVMPGLIQTEAVEKALASEEEKGRKEDAMNAQVLGLGKSLDVANAVAFLLSDAGRFITGTHMVVDGGYLA